MRFLPIDGSDARLIELKVHGDERGSFARTWCAALFREAQIDFTPVQGNSSVTRKRGAIRGMHFQRAPRADAKIVRCSRGRIHDVIVDLRETSPSRGKTYTHELSGTSGTILYVPPGFAHGFQTLTDDVIVEYLMGDSYVPELYDGFRYDDPALELAWPSPVTSVSAGDLAWPDLEHYVPWIREARP